MWQSTGTAEGSKLMAWQVSGLFEPATGGQRRIGQERLPLDLAEYVGCDNHRNETIETQKKLVMKQLEKPRI